MPKIGVLFEGPEYFRAPYFSLTKFKTMNLKLIISSVIVLLFINIATAQKGGIKGGVNFSNLYADDVSEENMKLGLNLGLWHRSADGILQTELNYSNKGAEIVYAGILGTGRYRYNLNYLELPVLYNLNLGNLNLHVGPYFGLLVGANIKDVDANGDINNVERLDRSDFNAVDYGLAGGVSLDFKASQLGVRYNYGLREIGKQGTFAGQAVSNAKNSALQLYIALIL